jgi:hypothetical protein
MRSIGAAMRAAERDAQRQRRARERYLAAMGKVRELEQAAQAVADYDTYVAQLISIHKEGADSIDWHALLTASAPLTPEPVRTRELACRARLENYRPSFLARLFGLQARQMKQLRAAIATAKREDEAETTQAHTAYQEKVTEHADRKELAERLFASDPDAIGEVIKTSGAFDALSSIGSQLDFAVARPLRISATLEVHGQQIIPKDKVTLLKSGKASVKAMPKGDYFRLYQDYVCSAILRIARDLFAILPVNDVIITALEECVSSQTGQLEKQPIVSAFIPRATFERLNLQAVDPSDSMKNFLHAMSFKATTGFSGVQLIDPPALAVEHR